MYIGPVRNSESMAVLAIKKTDNSIFVGVRYSGARGMQASLDQKNITFKGGSMDFNVLLKKAFGIILICFGAYLVYHYETHQKARCSAAVVERTGACPGNAKKTCIYVGIPSLLIGAWLLKGYRLPKAFTESKPVQSAATPRPQERMHATSFGQMSDEELGALVRKHLLNVKETDTLS